MKKNRILFGIAAVLAFAVSCQTKVDIQDTVPECPQGEKITITADLSNALTKVEFTPGVDGSSKPVLELAWKSGDKLRVADHSNNSSYSDFELDAASIGQKTGSFTGTPVSASSYDVWVVNDAMDFAAQAQPADGDASGLQYNASVEGITNLSDIVFSDVSSVLMFTAKNLPAGVAATIKSVAIKAFNSDGTASDIFNGGNSLTVTLGSEGDAGTDNNLVFYASLPKGSKAIPAGTSMLVKLNASSGDQDVYTRYFTIPSEVTLAAGKLNDISVGCANVKTHAGAASCDGSNAAKAYLLGDKYQMQAIDGLLNSQKRYFKLIDDIDMKDVSWSKANAVSPYKPFEFDGNNKTISNLGGVLFYIINGTVKDLTLDHSNLTSQRGALAEYIQGSGNVVSNVTVSNGSISSGQTNTGGLIGCINNGSSADVVTATITNCTVSDTNVSGTGVSGGMVGFADAKVVVSGCACVGGTVEASERFCGGMFGSTGNYNSVITDCHVEGATINAKVTNNDYRAGGFIGQLQTKVSLKGCSAGTPSSKVAVIVDAPASGKVYNAGGFVGVCYGTITKNGEVRSKAYTTVTSNNPSNETASNLDLNLGGVAGYNTGTIEYFDADVSVSACGKYVGGFCGRLLVSGMIRNCTVTGSVSGNTGTGGFVGLAEATSSLESCSADVAVTRTGSWGSTFGGFAGFINCSSVTKCCATHIIEVDANYVGGFAGSIETAASKTTTVSKCWSTGNVTSASAQSGGFLGHIAADVEGTVIVEDCYETGNLTAGNQRKGGLIGQIYSGIITVSRCYATASMTAGSFGQGGLVGFMNCDATIQDCAAWNSDVLAANIGNGNWSTGAVIGVAWPVATITNNFRNPDMNVKAFWGNVTDYTKELAADYDHPDVSASSPLIVADKSNAALRATTATAAASGQDNYPLFAYHGKHSSTNRLSTLASKAKGSGGLGWSSEVWDFTADLPVLK